MKQYFAAAFFLVSCGGCATPIGSEELPANELKIAGGGGEGVSVLVLSKPGRSVLVGSMPLCVDSGLVDVTAVAPVSGSLAIIDYVVRANPFLEKGGMMIGDARGTLADNNVESTDNEVRASCGDDTGIFELVVQSSGLVDATARNLQITYSDGGDEGNLIIPIEITVCFSRTTPECREFVQQSQQ